MGKQDDLEDAEMVSVRREWLRDLATDLDAQIEELQDLLRRIEHIAWERES